MSTTHASEPNSEVEIMEPDQHIGEEVPEESKDANVSQVEQTEHADVDPQLLPDPDHSKTDLKDFDASEAGARPSDEKENVVTEDLSAEGSAEGSLKKQPSDSTKIVSIASPMSEHLAETTQTAHSPKSKSGSTAALAVGKSPKRKYSSTVSAASTQLRKSKQSAKKIGRSTQSRKPQEETGKKSDVPASIVRKRSKSRGSELGSSIVSLKMADDRGRKHKATKKQTKMHRNKETSDNTKPSNDMAEPTTERPNNDDNVTRKAKTATARTKQSLNEKRFSVFVERLLAETSMSDLSDISTPPIYVEGLPRQSQFFDDLNEIVSFSELESSNESSESIALQEQPEPEEVSGKRGSGVFVDPLTGRRSSSSEETINRRLEEEKRLAALKAAMEAQMKSEKDDDIFDITEDDELLILLEEDEKSIEEMVDQHLADENTFRDFAATEAKHVAHEPTIDYDALEHEKNELTIVIHEFLDELTQKVVKYCEISDTQAALRKKLDKRSLMASLSKLAAEFQQVQVVNQLYTQKAIDHFRLKHKSTSIMEDDPAMVHQYQSYLEESMKRIDFQMGREDYVLNVMQDEKNALEVECEELARSVESTVDEFNEMVRNTFNRKRFGQLKMVVDKDLASIDQKRKEISEIRLQLLKLENSLASVLQDTEKVDRIADGLYMEDFQFLQASTQILGQKYEERCAEVKRLQERTSTDIQIMAHMRERDLMLRASLKVETGLYQQMSHASKKQRHHILNQKLEHGKLRKHISNLSFKSGLLDKPMILRDYDVTASRLQDMRSLIEAQEEKCREVQIQINKLALVAKEENLNSYSPPE